jgi:hypothetical protein
VICMECRPQPSNDEAPFPLCERNIVLCRSSSIALSFDHFHTYAGALMGCGLSLIFASALVGGQGLIDIPSCDRRNGQNIRLQQQYRIAFRLDTEQCQRVAAAYFLGDGRIEALDGGEMTERI